MCILRKCAFVVLAAGGLFALNHHSAQAVPVDCPVEANPNLGDVAVCTVTDSNSSFTVVASDDILAAVQWSIGGVNHLKFQQFDLFDVPGPDTGDAFLDFAQFDPDTRQIATSFTEAGRWSGTVNFTLTDTISSAVVDEQIAIQSFDDTQRRLFVYTNFDLNGTAEDGGTSVANVGVGGTRISQSDGLGGFGLDFSKAFVEVANGPNPDALQIDIFPTLTNLFNEEDLFDLDNDPTDPGPGDIEFAFSWDIDSVAGETFSVDLRKKVENPVFFPPPPGSDPDPDDDLGAPFEFDIDEILADIEVFLDPDVAIGYIYTVGDGNPNFASVRLPAIGDNLFQVLFDGVIHDVVSGDAFLFPSGGVPEFTVLGIEPAAMLDPLDPRAFVTGVTFVGPGSFTGTMTPILAQVESVPETSTLALFGVGIVGLLFVRRRRINV